MATPEEFLLEFGLYVSVSPSEEYDLLDYCSTPQVLDAFCVRCGKQSVFREGVSPHRPAKFIPSSVGAGSGTGRPAFADVPSGRGPREIAQADPSEDSFTRVFLCTRDPSHTITFHFVVEDDRILKVGQFPSHRDLASSGPKEWFKALPPPSRHDYQTAIGLYSHGVGAGALVYLRRVYEHLLHAEYERALADGVVSEQKGRPRVGDLLRLLADRLPGHMSENPVVYGVLSEGVHALAEDECLDAFPVLKEAIDLILLDAYRRLEEERVRDTNRRALNRINSLRGKAK